MTRFKKMLSLLCALAMLATSFALPALAEDYDADYCYAEGYDVSVQLEAEGAVLLKNDEKTLPLQEGTKVTILSAMSYNYVEGGTGSAGGKDDENTVILRDAFLEAGLDVNEAAWAWLEELCGGARGVNSADPDGVGWTEYRAIHEFPIAAYEGAADTILQEGYTDYAVVTISRSGAEGASPSMDYDGDGSTLTGTTYLELDQDEKDLLSWCKQNFKHTIVLVNSAAAMELGFINAEEYNIDACLWIGHPGEAGVVGVGTLLTGRSNPSGRLVDTYAYDMTTNPTYYNTDNNRYTNGQTFYQYEEGIYVGYRYFETADAVGYFDSDEFAAINFKNGAVKGYEQVVQFPFGFGMSYTTFTQEVVASDVKLAPHGENTITVKVTNIGDVAGKQVVQLYMDAPYQTDTENFGIKGVGLEKAKVVLAGFEKTKILQPGESQEVTISFSTDDPASFDNFGQGCYVLENGIYSFDIQENAHYWGEEGSDNAAYASVKVDLAAPIIYDDAGDVANAIYAGARDSDAVVAKNAMDDVTAGDGNMLPGYLSRNDISGGMAQIMTHTSNEAANESVTDAIQAVLDVSNTDSVEYTFQTYRNGVLTTITETLYAHGNNMMPFSTQTPDGIPADSFEDPLWEQEYWVIEGQKDENGLPVVVDEKPRGVDCHKFSVNDMAGVTSDIPGAMELYEKLANMTSIDEALEVQGNSGWQISAVKSVGKKAGKTVDGPGEASNGGFAGNTWFPCAVTIAATWNRDLANAQGVAYGHQAKLAGQIACYSPAMNTHRSPFGGRNFEYYSEDGFIAGEIGGNVVSGVQSAGISVFIKHCSLNDGDTNRGGNTTWANEQAIREIYMRCYEIAIKEYGANGVMGSLNRIGMSWYHYGMYVTMMRNEWAWEGYLITDGDGGASDCYNPPVAMLSIEGAMLARGLYSDARSTMAAYGDCTDTVYGRYCLHQVMRHCLYQYCTVLDAE